MEIKESIKRLLEGETQDVSLQDLESTFDPQGLEKAITKLLGVEANVKVTLKPARRGGFLVGVTSDNFVSSCGPMAQVWSFVRVCEFGGSINLQDDAYVAWVPVSLEWESLRGGSNGGDLLVAWYNFTAKTWTVETAKERHGK